jgi:hypothetical protein
MLELRANGPTTGVGRHKNPAISNPSQWAITKTCCTDCSEAGYVEGRGEKVFIFARSDAIAPLV